MKTFDDIPIGTVFTWSGFYQYKKVSNDSYRNFLSYDRQWFKIDANKQIKLVKIVHYPRR